jgi:prepilin-type N-terminal cleavage/methylation domain-containing protein
VPGGRFLEKEHPMKRARARSAFTLTELLVVIGIMALLTLMTLPVLTPLIKNKALDASASRLQAAIFKTRSLAAKANANYYLSFNTIDANKHMMVIYQDYMDSGTGELIVIGEEFDEGEWNTILWTDAKKSLVIVDQPIYLQEGTGFASDDPGSAEDFIIAGKCGKERILCFTPTGEVYAANDDSDGFPTLSGSTYTLRLIDNNDDSLVRSLNINKWTGEVKPQ